MPVAAKREPRRAPRSGILAASAVLLFLAGASQADPGVSSSYTASETFDTKKSIRKIWSNFLAGYSQARNAAKSVVRQMQLTQSLAHSMVIPR